MKKSILFILMITNIVCNGQSCVETCMDKFNPITEQGKLVECTLSCGGKVGETLGGLYNQLYNSVASMIGMGDKATETTLKELKTTTGDELSEVNGNLEEVNNNIKTLRDHNSKFREVLKSHSDYFSKIKAKVNDPNSGYLAISNNIDKMVNDSKALLSNANCKFSPELATDKNKELDNVYKRKEIEVGLYQMMAFDKTGTLTVSESSSEIKLYSQYGTMYEGERTMLIKQMWENIQDYEVDVYVINAKLQKSCKSAPSVTNVSNTKVKNMNQSYQQHDAIEILKQHHNKY